MDAVDEVRAAGFDAINCDLIYAVPGLDDDRWVATLERVIGADPGHISCYELTVEPGTALHAAVAAGRAPAVDEGAALRHHRLAVALLETSGYDQYEVSNFARQGRECRHNLAYWRNQHYLAAGVGAHGHVPSAAAVALGLDADDRTVGVRYWHPRGVPGYRRMASGGLFPISGYECVNGAAREVERLMLGLRLNEGVRSSGIQAAGLLAGSGLVTFDGDVVRTTPGGQEVLNEVVARLAV
jgi:oxygen-independent coproporphyrinogen-3 oxidase